MNKSIFSFLGIFTIVILSVSCVSGRKYSSLQDTSTQFMNERDAFKTDNIGLEMENRELVAKLATLETEIGTVTQDITLPGVNATGQLKIIARSHPNTTSYKMPRKI